ncbi:MAG: hypothetical protein J6N21_02955 [Butyrivibrio sp.]|nr:hypothetical protein [Lachnospiraceae bacterium]MBP3195946.1 hypothetical protein [Butyrivibrio sp.]
MDNNYLAEEQKKIELQENLFQKEEEQSEISINKQVSQMKEEEHKDVRQSIIDKMDAVEEEAVSLEKTGKDLSTNIMENEDVLFGVRLNKTVMSPSTKTRVSHMNQKKSDNSVKLVEKTKLALEEKILFYKDKAFFGKFLKDFEMLDKKGSSLYLEVKASLKELDQRLKAFEGGINDSYNLSAIVDSMFRASEAVRGYLETHKGHRITIKGSDKKLHMEFLNKAFNDIMSNLSEEVGAASTVIENVEYTPEQLKIAKENVKELKKNYDEMAPVIGKGYFDTAEEKIQKRLSIFYKYREEIRIYRAAHKEKMDSDMKKMFDEMDNLSKQAKLLYWMKTNVNSEMQKDDVMQTLREQSYEKSERKDKSKEVENPRKYDDSLEPEQLAGIEQIDRWFMRNWNNGGFAGKALTFLKAGCSDIMFELFKKSKRERLHIYYLIETRRRKNADAMDVGASQMYVPTLEGFKDQMLASAFKVKSHMTSGYVYFHKLSEAMNITNSYRDMIFSCGKLLSEEKEDEKQKDTQQEKQENKQNTKEDSFLNTNPALVEAREEKLKNATVGLMKYQRLLMKCQKDKTEDDEQTKALIKKESEQVKKLMKELVDADEQVRQDFEAAGGVINLKYNEVNDKVDYTNLAIKVGSVGAGFMDTAVLKTSDILKIGWGLGSLGDWTDLEAWSGSVSGTLSAVGSVLSCLLNVYNLTQYGDSMTTGELAEGIFSTIGNLGGIVKNVWSTVETVNNAENYATQIINNGSKVVARSAGVTAATGAVAVISAATGLAKMGTVVSECTHIYGALSAIKSLHEKRIMESESDEEIKKIQNEAKYEYAALTARDKKRDRKITSGAFLAGAGVVSIAGISTAAAVSGVGIIFTIVGLGITVVSSIVDAVKSGKANTAFFDNFLNMPEIAKKVKEALKKKGRPIGNEKHFMEQLRRRVAACLGFANVASAADQLSIVSAKHIYNKLFVENLTDEERNGYIEFVKSLGVKYKAGDEKSRRPKLLALQKAISGR